MAIWRYIVGGILVTSVISAWGADPQPIIAPRASGHPAASSDSFSFDFTTPPVSISEEADGSSTIALRGFARHSRRPGAPDLPTRVVLVAIPPDSSPSLELRPGAERRYPRVRPVAVPRTTVELAPLEREELERQGRDTTRRVDLLQRSARKLHRPDRSIYEGTTPFPRRVAWLGRTGTLRDQRYVEVHLAPVRYDPRLGGLRVLESGQVVVRFNRSSSEPLVEQAPDPRFEEVYRDAFVNYGQSRGFRLTRDELGEPIEIRTHDFSKSTPSTPRQRIRVREDGIIRIDESLLQPTGFLAYDLSTWRLTNRGTAVPLQTNDDGDGILEPGEWIQFYGERLDDEPKTVLNTDFVGGVDDLYEARDFTDENTYFLEVAAQAQPPMSVRDAAPTLTRTPPTSFRELRHEEVDDAYRPLADADPWYWKDSLLYSSPTKRSRTDTVALPGLVSGTEPATFRVHLRGLDSDSSVDPDHLTRLTIENASPEVVTVDDAMFDGLNLHLQQIDWSWSGGAQLTDPINLTLEVLDSGATCSGSPCNSVILDYIEVEYARAFTAIDDRLVFEWPDGDAEFVVDGVQDPSAGVYEITSEAGQAAVRPVRLLNAGVSGAGPYALRFRVDEDPAIPDGTPRRFAVVGQGAISSPAPSDFEADDVSDLRDNTIQADLIVIAHPDVLDDSAGGALDQLLTHRSTAAGGGLSSKLVLLQDVEDEFNHGLPGPLAIKEFLRWVLSDQPGEGWSDPKPSYVILLGDASYDYKGGEAQGNFVPTQMLFQDNPILGHYASDNVMAAVVGDDQLADLVVGRIPARNVVDANRMLQKIVDYELLPEPGPWRSHALFISDRGKLGRNPAEALQFEALNLSSEAEMQIPPYSSRHLRYWTDYFDTPDPTPWESINIDLKDAVNGRDGIADGAAIVQFIGHGNFLIWSDDFFFDERISPPIDDFQDSMDLDNAVRLPWLMAHNCLTGGFHVIAYNSIAENWFKLPGGGSVGAFAPTGLSFNFVSDHVTEVVWKDLFGRSKKRVVGPVVMDTLVRLCTQGTIEACQYYALQGDPAMRFALPDVKPATSIQAIGANATVNLSWTASTTPDAVYDVYRTQNVPFNTYFKIADDLDGTSFADTNVVNVTKYFYYVVAEDPAGFESSWSNFNSDCDAAGLDCVEATPLNPNSPAPPTGVAVTDPGLGTVLEVTWAPNIENDIGSYTVHYGMESGNYTSTVDAGPRTRLTLLDLVEGQMYHFVVTATNTSGQTSDPSAEVSDYPVAGFGLRAPSYVKDLMLGKSGSDVVLSWTEVTTDIYGKPETVALYEIFRGTAPGYDGANLTKIGECASPCGSFTDPGGLLLPGGAEYRVRAVDFESNAGGMGSEPPSPVQLGVAKPAGASNNLLLHWQPVSTTVDGSPVDLQHYAIYAADQPFTRADVRDGLVPLLTTVTSPSLELTPPMQNRYYSVLGVDRRGNASPF